VLDHEDQGTVVSRIVEYIRDKPDPKVILIGHSLDGDSAVKTAEPLEAEGIEVDLLIQIDSVGFGDEEKPGNVERGVNIYSTSGEGIDGAQHVDGLKNCGLDDTTHTDTPKIA
jgi:thioesterase domain-containing protein